MTYAHYHIESRTKRSAMITIELSVQRPVQPNILFMLFKTQWRVHKNVCNPDEVVKFFLKNKTERRSDLLEYVAGFLFYFYFCSSNPQARSSPSRWILICFCLIWMWTSILPAEMVNSYTHLCHKVVINNNHLWGWWEGNLWALRTACSNIVLWSFL